MQYEKAFQQFYDEFCSWIMDNNFVGNGDMLIRYLEDGESFDAFMIERHPEIGELQ